MRINLNYKNLKTHRAPSRRKVFFTLLSFVLSGLLYYYWQNRYVELCPVILKEYYQPIILFDNQLYKFAEPNEVPANYYKNIDYVIDRSVKDYIKRDGKIYVRYKLMNDLNLIWNYTLWSTDPEWFKMKREMDSVNGDDYEKVIYYR